MHAQIGIVKHIACRAYQVGGITAGIKKIALVTIAYRNSRSKYSERLRLRIIAAEYKKDDSCKGNWIGGFHGYIGWVAFILGGGRVRC